MELDIKNLEFSFNNVKVINNVSFTARSGEIFAILGKNGSGKTTILKLIAGILHPFDGSITIESVPIKQMKRSEVARIMGVVPQNFEPGFDFTVEELVKLGRLPYFKFFENNEVEDLKIVENVMKLTDMLSLRHKSIFEISGGERQRAIIAMVLAQTPKIVILDEPTSNLDIKYQIEIFEILRTLAKEKNIMIIISLHDVNLASRFCDKGLILKDGKIVAIGEIEEILNEQNLSSAYDLNIKILKNGFGSMIYPYLNEK